MAEQPAPWLEEILQTAGDISPSAASKIRESAEDAYRRGSIWMNEAWTQYGARYAAKMVLAGVAAESRPAVQAAFRRYQEAEEQANRLFVIAERTAGSRSVDILDDLDTQKWLDVDEVRRAAGELKEAYRKTFAATRAHYVAEVNKAWRQADKDFLISHRAELEAADPAGFKHLFGRFKEDSSPSAGSAPAPQPAGPSETGHSERELSAASAGPYTVTGWFTTNVGPSLHYTLQGTAGRELDYWRMPDGTAGAQIRSGDRWFEIDPDDPRYQAVIEGVQEYEAKNPDLARYNNPQAASAARADESHGIAKVPDLSKLPADPEVRDRESVNDWSLQSMKDHLDALKACDAYHHASHAAELQKSGGSHQDIIQALAAAEMAAPEKDRSFHAGRLDQYASAHGLKGWYRHQTSRGEHLVQVNKIRMPAEGDKGRYYASDPFAKGTARVVDRDTGKFVTPAMDPKAARDWISNAESARLETALQHAATGQSPGTPGVEAAVTDSTTFPAPLAAVAVTGGQPGRAAPRAVPARRRTPGKGR